jgi:hypothetical protein
VEEAPADEIRGLHCYDSMRVIGAGGDPDFGYGVAMIRTSDGGIHWNYDELGIQGTTYDIDFRTPAEAWAPLGPKQTLIYSLDSGITWTEVSTPANSIITSITFPDSLHGYAVGRDGAMLRYVPPFHPGIRPHPGTTEEVVIMTCFREMGMMNYELKIMKEGRGWFELLDLFGQVVYREPEGFIHPGTYDGSFDAGGLRDGLYLARFIFRPEDGANKPLIIIRKVMK